MTRNFGWMVTGHAGYAVAQGALLVVLARLGTTEAVGVFALGLAIATPIAELAQLGLRDVLATDAADEHGFGEYLGLATTTAALSVATAWAVAVGLGYGASTVVVVVLVAVSKAVEGMILVFYGLQQRHERMSRVGVSLLARGALAVAGFAAGFVAGGRALAWGVVGLIAANVVVLVAYDMPQGLWTLGTADGRRPVSARRVLRLARRAAPLGMTAVLVSATVSIPRVILERSAGESELGIFAALAYLVVASTVVARALALSAAPQLARAHVARDRARYRRLLSRVATLTATLGAVGIVLAAALGRPVLTLLYGAEYGAEWRILILVMAYGATMFVALPMMHAMIAARRLAAQFAVLCAVVATAAGAGIVLIPHWGMAGAALTLIAAGIVRLAGSWVVIHSVLRGGSA
jgi:O-antigen/teichoic acid export membrane protein